MRRAPRFPLGRPAGPRRRKTASAKTAPAASRAAESPSPGALRRWPAGCWPPAPPPSRQPGPPLPRPATRRSPAPTRTRIPWPATSAPGLTSYCGARR
nr:hypothetical protein [Bacillota bacterium]